jgi:EAL domain-containing protein (putative c-di-GMP-specific phosphodiesterase class I)
MRRAETMTASAPRALVLDDDPSLAELVGALARRGGFEVTTTTLPGPFQQALMERPPELIVLDLQMPALDGVRVLRLLGDAGCRAGILLVTGMDVRTIAAAEEYGRSRGLKMLGGIQKPFSPEELFERFRSIRATCEELTADDLRRALAERELLLHYQPTICRAGQGRWSMSAVEALLRWNHPERGLLSPASFLKLGEDAGLSQPLAQYVLEWSLAQLCAWRERGLNLTRRVNISAQVIQNLDFPDHVDELLARNRLDPSVLTIEITETAMLEHEATTIDVLTRLRVKNVNLAIDDFGVGYSSLTQLFRMPFNEMKIDKSLILKVPQSEEARIMVETLVGLAHRLSLTACAEGIEGPEVMSFLDQIGCDAAQGYWISTPVAPSDVPRVLSQWPRVLYHAGAELAVPTAAPAWSAA